MAAVRNNSSVLPASIPLPLEIGLLLVILLLAGLLRMAAPGLTEFKADEARLMALALDMAEGQFALRGISSSVGFPNFPASVWIYSLPLLLWPHPYAATLFTGLLNTFAVAAAYGFVRRYWGLTAAMVATLMFAVSPWAVIFSRKIWAQNLLPLFVAGWAISAALALVEERPKFIWLHFLCLALAVQIHLAAAALVAATAVLLLIFRRRVQWRSLLIGLAIAGLTIIPFAIYLANSDAQISLPSSTDGTSEAGISAASLLFATMISLGTNIHSLAGPQVFSDYLASIPQMTTVYLLWSILILSGITWLGWQAWTNWQRSSSQAGVIVLVWFFIPPLFFLWHSTPVFLHYFIATMPAQYITAGVAFSLVPAAMSRLWPAASENMKRFMRITAWGVLIATVFAQLSAQITLINFVANKATPGAFGVPLAMKLDAADQARSLYTLAGASEILVAGEGESPRLDAFPAVWDVLLRDTPHRFVDVRSSALFPAAKAVVLLDGRERAQPWAGDLYLQASPTTQEISLRSGEGSFYVLALDSAAGPAPAESLDPPLLFANWVKLTGSDKLQRLDPETGLWQVHWQTADNPDPAQYQFFNHLLDGDDARIGQVDEAAFTPRQWSTGDTVISRFLIPWPETIGPPLTMRVGMYRYPSLENVPLLDEAGNPYLDAVIIPIDN